MSAYEKVLVSKTPFCECLLPTPIFLGALRYCRLFIPLKISVDAKSWCEVF